MKKAKVGLGAAILIFILIQFIRPSQNNSGDDQYHIRTIYPTPQTVDTLLSHACYNCHSNRTIYPWYDNVEPVGWLVAHDVKEGKEHLNFSEFATYPAWKQFHLMEEVDDVLEDKEMPPKIYTLFGLHKEARLTDEERENLISWSESVRDSISNKYPPDSLQRPKKGAGKHRD